jgi:hypothetical protein
VGVALAALLLTPLLGPGYVLVRDMVFVPRIPLGGQLLGLDGVPRGVPSELLVALASRVVATGWLQDAILLAIVVGGAWGAARLVPTTSRAAAVAAATTYGWSAYLHERLLLGQWALLVGWAVLPWAAHAALAWRRGHPGWPAIACLAVAATGGASAVLLVGLVVVCCGRPLKAIAATALLSVPWVLPGLLHDVTAGDPAGVAAFAAAADTPLGVVGSLLTGGGVWAPAGVPPGRSAGVVAAILVLLVGAVGLPRLRTRLGDRFVLAGGLGLLLALLGNLPGSSGTLRWAVEHIPATGLLRDGQKWLAPFVLLTAAAVACGAEVVLARIPTEQVRRVAAALLVLAPLAALPGAAWAEGGRLTVSHYPGDWEHVTRQARGAVVVLPWTLYRAFPWGGDRTVLDPATKLLTRPVVNDDLPLVHGSVQGEDLLAARLDAAARSGEPMLPALLHDGIAMVLVEKSTRGADLDATKRQTQGLSVVTETRELALYAVPGGGSEPARGPMWPVVLGDLVAAAYGLAAVGFAVRGRRPY